MIVSKHDRCEERHPGHPGWTTEASWGMELEGVGDGSRETPNLSTNVNNSTNIFWFSGIKKKKFNPELLLFLRLYKWVHKCTSQTLLPRGPFMSAIWNNSLFLRLG